MECISLVQLETYKLLLGLVEYTLLVLQVECTLVEEAYTLV